MIKKWINLDALISVIEETLTETAEDLQTVTNIVHITAQVLKNLSGDKPFILTGEPSARSLTNDQVISTCLDRYHERVNEQDDKIESPAHA